MIPKNGRNQRKQLSPHNSNNSKNHKASSKVDMMQHNSTSSKASALPTITRSSNHSTAEYSKSNDADSACSWMELDFDHAEGAAAREGKGKKTKPISHVNIAQYLVDDQESAYVATSDKEEDDSSTTSNLSEDFSVENRENNNGTDNNKGDAKVDNRNRNTSSQNEEKDDDSVMSVTSFYSESSPNGIPFDDLLAESLMASSNNLTSNSLNQNDIVPPLLDEVIERGNVGVTIKPTSYRSSKTEESISDATKPTSELSKSSGSKRLQKKISPKLKQSKKKAPGHKSKSPGPIQGRKRLQSTTYNRESGEGTSDIEAKENDRKHSSKQKQKSVPKSTRRRHPQSPGGDDDETNDSAFDNEQKDAKKKVSPKTKTTSAVPSQRRQRPRPTDGDQAVSGNGEGEGKKQPSERSILEGSNRSLGGTGDAKRKQERHRIKSKSSSGSNNSSSGKAQRRKPPSRSGSGEVRRNRKGEADRNEKREIRKRYKKKAHGSDNEMEDSTERESGTKIRSGHRERKENVRRKSNSSETKEPKPDRSSTEKKRKKKKQPAESKAIATEDEISPKPAICESEEGDAELTYSFHFQSEDGSRNGVDWLNTNNSTSSSLSYNSFAQFSLDVTEMNRSGTFHVPDIDNSQRSFSSNPSIEASVVFMEGKSRSRHSSLHTAHSFDGDNDSRGDNDTGTRSTRSCPTGLAEGSVIKPEKQLRRRLKKKEQSTEKEGNQNRNESNVEVKKKVRRTKSSGGERTKDLSQSDAVSAGRSGGGRRNVQRTRSHNESIAQRSSSASKRRDGNEKSTRRKREKHLNLAHAKLKQVVKSKSAHIRSLSISPKISPKRELQKGKILLPSDQSDISDSLPGDKVILLNDMDDEANAPDAGIAASWRSPKRSPKVRQGTLSKPCPSPSIHIAEVTTPSLRGKNAIDVDCSPISFPGSSPSHIENQKRVRKPSPSRRALLSTDTESDDENYQSETDYISESPGSAHRRISRGSLQRTPSSLLSAVRNFKHNSSNKMQNSSNKMLSNLKRTFSVSGRGPNTFKNSALEEIEIGMTTMKGYVSRKERQRKIIESESRRGQVQNSLYACMSDDDDSVDISASGVFEDESESSYNISIDNTDRDQSSISSFKPKRVKSLEKTKMNQPSDDQGPERPSRPRRVHSLPVGLRR